MNPLISIIIPIYKPNIDYIQQCLNSVTHQSFKDFEIILVYDNKLDNIQYNLINNIVSNHNFKIIHSFSSNIPTALNCGIVKASGLWVTFLDQDDLLHLKAFETVFRAIRKNPDCEFIYTNESKFNQSGSYYDQNSKPLLDEALILNQNYLCHSLYIKNELLAEVGLFDPLSHGSQDWDLALRIIYHERKIKYIRISKYLYYWRAHSQSSSVTLGTKKYIKKSQLYILSKFFSKYNYSVNLYYRHGNFISFELKNHLINACHIITFGKSKFRNYEYTNKSTTIKYYHFKKNEVFLSIQKLKYKKGDFILLLNENLLFDQKEIYKLFFSYLNFKYIGCIGPKITYKSKFIKFIKNFNIKSLFSLNLCSEYEIHKRIHLLQKKSIVNKCCIAFRAQDLNLFKDCKSIKEFQLESYKKGLINVQINDFKMTYLSE